MNESHYIQSMKMYNTWADGKTTIETALAAGQQSDDNVFVKDL